MKSYWPNDDDGDVLRRLSGSGFDFSATHKIDFNIDFKTWPPPAEFISQLRAQYAVVQQYEPDDAKKGYVLFVVEAVLSYELVIFVQDSVSALAAPYGGVCESWGILH